MLSRAMPGRREDEMYRRGSRKQDIEMAIKIEIQRGNIKKSIDIAEKYGITPKRYGELVKQVASTG